MAIDLLSCLSLVPSTMLIRWQTTGGAFRELRGRVQARAIGSNEIEVEIVPESETRLTEKRLYFGTIRYVPVNLNLGLFMGLWLGEGVHLKGGKNDIWGLQTTDFEIAQLFIRLLKEIFQCPEDRINPVIYIKPTIYRKLSEEEKKALEEYIGKYLRAKRTYLQKEKYKKSKKHYRIFIRLQNLALYTIVLGLEEHSEKQFTEAYDMLEEIKQMLVKKYLRPFDADQRDCLSRPLNTHNEDRKYRG